MPTDGGLTAQAIAARFPNAINPTSTHPRIPCPAHGGDDPNLVLWTRDDGSIGAKCWSRDCAHIDIMRALDVPAPRRKDRQPCAAAGCNFGLDSLVAIYHHPDGPIRCSHRWDFEAGSCWWRNCRDKDRRHKHVRNPGSSKGLLALVWGEDRDGDELLIVEGEKAAAAVMGYGLEGVTPVSYRSGAQSAHLADYRIVQGRDVVVWPDADDPGERAAEVVASAVTAAGASRVRIVDVSGDPDGADAADFDGDVAARRIAVAEPYAARQPVDVAIGVNPTNRNIQEAAQRLILSAPEEMVLARRDVEPSESPEGSQLAHPPEYVLYAVGPDGVLDGNGGLQVAYFRAVDSWLQEAFAADKVDGGFVAFYNRLKSPAGYRAVVEALPAAARALDTDGALPDELVVVACDDLNMDMTAIGVANGVLDLAAGELLPRDEARRRLVTLRAPTRWEPDAKDWRVDLLMRTVAEYDADAEAHPDGDAEARRDSWDMFAWMLTHPPRRELFGQVTAPASGKTAMRNAMRAVFGHYVRETRPETLERASRRDGSTAHNSGLRMFAPPTRLVFSPEASGGFDLALLNALSGGERSLPIRMLHQNEREAVISAGLVIQGNPPPTGRPFWGFGSAGEDERAEALMGRLRLAPLQPLADPSPAALRPDDAPFREAFLARFVSEYCARQAQRDAAPTGGPSMADELRRRAEMDKPAWLREWLPEALVEDATASCNSYQAYADLEAWWDDNAEGRVPPQQTVTKAVMDAYGLDPAGVRQTLIRVGDRRKKVRLFEGYRLAGDGAPAEPVQSQGQATMAFFGDGPACHKCGHAPVMAFLDGVGQLLEVSPTTLAHVSAAGCREATALAERSNG